MRRHAALAAALLLAGLLAGGSMNATPAPQQANTRDRPAVGTQGMVSSAHPLATEAGLEILAAGGNAFDAAVAVAAALNVVEPHMSGIGGYGTIMTYAAEPDEAFFLNCSGRIPAGVDSDAFRAPTPNYMQNRRGAKAVSTPGNVNAWEAMSRRYGSLPWNRLFEPAIKLAEEGFVLTGGTASSIRSAFNAFPAHAQAFYGADGRPLNAGERLVQRDLGRSFRLIAEQGAGVVHGGELGRAIDAAMREADGFLRLQDLADNEAEWWEPIAIDYRGYQIVTSPPPANSFDMLVRIGMMGQLDARELGHNSADYLHYYAEATKHGFWVRLRYAGSPEVTPPPLARLLSTEYFAEEVAKIDPRRASRFTPPGVGGGEDGHTTHYVVADARGNVVSATQTLGNAFGARIMPPGTGIWLNNSLAYSTFEPKGNAMDAFPGRHKLSGDCPTLIMKDGRLWAALGTPGGHSIGQTVPQMVFNLIDFELDIQRALAAPRISFSEPDRLVVEAAIPEEVRRQLAERGHNVNTGRLGNAHGLTLERDAQGNIVRFLGGADPRGQGEARGR